MSDPGAGDVWKYPFLWARQADQGETEGRKERPVAVVAVVRDSKGNRVLALLPVTTKRPDSDRLFLELPQTEARRVGLTTERPLWVIVDEYNHDVLEMSWYFDPDARIGCLGAVFLSQLSLAFRSALAGRKTQRVRRDL